MKKSYKEHFDQLSLKDEYKEEISKNITMYDHNKANHRRTSTRFVVASLAFLLVLVLPIFMNYVGDSDSRNEYIIKASDTMVSISKNEILIKDYRQFEDPQYIFITNAETGLMKTNPISFPLSVYVSGKNIKSITYTIKNAEFYKINEIEDVVDGLNTVACPGCFIQPKKQNTFSQLTKKGNSLPGDVNKPNWWFDVSSIASSTEGNKITIAYNDQGNVKGFYGIAHEIYDKEIVSTMKESYNEESMKRAEAKLIESINNTLLDVRINYKDGSYTSKQLHFKVDKKNIPKITK